MNSKFPKFKISICIMLQEDNDKAPFFKSWNVWYILVIAFLVLLIILFSLFTKQFS